MTCKSSIAMLLLFLTAFLVSTPVWAQLTIRAQTDVELDMVIYNGLDESSLFMGSIHAGTHREVDTSYKVLALLVFPSGQRYPIIGDEPLTLRIDAPNVPPYFSAGSENEFFYKLLSSGDSESGQYTFPQLMIQAKKLVESSHDIHTIKELLAKKIEFHTFVGEHYDRLKHSDIVKRLIAEYFMMHEYVDYHCDGAPATDISVQYEKAVLEGVESWIGLLRSHIPVHEILNYCVSLYYNRSMVTLASLIINNHGDAAYCMGVEKHTFTFPKDLIVTDADRDRQMKMDSFKPKKIIAFVSADCPVSMVETVVKARRLVAQKNDAKLIVVPLQQLSDKHLAMSRMVSGENLLFVDDEKWRIDNLSTKIKLPLFIEIQAE